MGFLLYRFCIGFCTPFTILNVRTCGRFRVHADLVTGKRGRGEKGGVELPVDPLIVDRS